VQSTVLYWRFARLRTAFYLLFDPKPIAYIAFLGCAGVSIYFPLWSCVILLDIYHKSMDLQNVVRAVTENFKSLIMTLIFGVMIIWIFAVIAFGLYPYIGIAWEERCSTVTSCLVVALSEGPRGGDIGAEADPDLLGDTDSTALVAFEVMYFAVVITILLNVIFGIIVDTFSELRAEKGAKKANMENFCFICGLDRFTLDTNGGGFDEHIEKHHNMWNYVYMLVHLREKDPNEYNGWEQYVADKVAASDTSFMPRHTAIAIAEYQEKEASEARERKSSVSRLLEDNAQLSKRLEQLVKDNAELPLRLSQQVADSVAHQVEELRDTRVYPVGLPPASAPPLAAAPRPAPPPVPAPAPTPAPAPAPAAAPAAQS